MITGLHEASGITAIAGDSISVVAIFVFIELTIAASDRLTNGLSIDRCASKALLIFTGGGTAIAIERISVIAEFIMRDFTVAAVIDAFTI